MFVKWQDHVYDFEIMIWNHVSDSGKSNAPLNTPVVYIMLTWLLALGTIRYDKIELLLTFSHRPNANKYISPVNHLHRKKRPYILLYSDWQPPARALTVTLTGGGGGRKNFYWDVIVGEGTNG